MVSWLEIVGGLCVCYALGKLVWQAVGFVYCSYVGNLLGLTPHYQQLGRWAVVTGATDGIGKAYAAEFARRGLDIVLISRTTEKLKRTATELTEKYGVEVLPIQMDFTQGLQEYAKIQETLKTLDIAVLVNNVGMALGWPEFFHKISSDSFAENILNCNCLSMTMMTRIVLPSMEKKRKGVIINLSSFITTLRPGLVAQYFATKSYVDAMSAGLQQELRGSGVIVQNVRPHFVISNMSQMKTAGFFVPTPRQFVIAQLRTVGLEDSTFGYTAHKIKGFMAQIRNTFLPEAVVNSYCFDLALRHKAERKGK